MLFEKLLIGATAVTPPPVVGDLFGTGGGGSGQFGRGTTADIGTPATWTSVNSSLWKQVVSATGGFSNTNTLLDASFSVGIKADGTLWSTGRNTDGNLGQGNTTSLTTWTQIGSSQWLYVTACTASTNNGQSRMTCLAVRSDGTLWGWGYNGHYQIGDGTTTQHNAPVQVGSATNWVKVLTMGQNSTGGDFGFTLGLRSDGTLWGWGNNVTGSTGQNTTSGSTTSPSQIGTDTDWADIAVGLSINLNSSASLYSLAIKSGGTLWGWGNNDTYQLGTGNTTSHLLPFQVGVATGWAKIFANPVGSSFGITTGGTLWSWGETTTSGMTAQGLTSGNVTTPTQVGSVSTWSEVSGGNIPAASGGYCLAVRTDSTLWGWGTNTNNNFGTGSTSPAVASSPIEVGKFAFWEFASAGGCSGSAGGVPVTSLGVRGIPAIFSPLYTFGSNAYGQTAQNTTSGNVNSPRYVASNQYTWTKVAPGCGGSGAGNGMMAILANGTLWSWGSNTQGSGIVATGSIGQGAVTLQLLVPTQVGSATNWTEIAQGTYGGLGVRSDGTMWGWGNDIWGQFGSGTAGTILYTPTQIGSGTDWAKVYTNGLFSFAIKTNGTLWSFGTNSGYSTGLGTNTGNTVTPTQVGVATNWTHIAVAMSGAIGIQSNGTAWSWGTETAGALVKGGTGFSTAPTQIGSATDWTWAASGTILAYSFLIKSTGTLWTIGSNASYQTGRGTNVGNTTTLTQIGSSTLWDKVYVVFDETGVGGGIARRTDNTFWGWGNEANGLLGNGSVSGTTQNPAQSPIGISYTNASSIAGNSGPGAIIGFG